MDSPSKLEECLLFFMALQTDIRALFCILTFKREQKAFTFCLHMLCSWAMAGFTFLSPMGIFLEKIVNVRMTLFAGLRPHIPFLLGLLLLAK
jgi:hypothetical protein